MDNNINKKKAAKAEVKRSDVKPTAVQTYPDLASTARTSQRVPRRSEVRAKPGKLSVIEQKDFYVRQGDTRSIQNKTIEEYRQLGQLKQKPANRRSALKDRNTEMYLSYLKKSDLGMNKQKLNESAAEDQRIDQKQAGKQDKTKGVTQANKTNLLEKVAAGARMIARQVFTAVKRLFRGQESTGLPNQGQQKVAYQAGEGMANEAYRRTVNDVKNSVQKTVGNVEKASVGKIQTAIQSQKAEPVLKKVAKVYRDSGSMKQSAETKAKRSSAMPLKSSDAPLKLPGKFAQDAKNDFYHRHGVSRGIGSAEVNKARLNGQTKTEKLKQAQQSSQQTKKKPTQQKSKTPGIPVPVVEVNPNADVLSNFNGNYRENYKTLNKKMSERRMLKQQENQKQERKVSKSKAL